MANITSFGQLPMAPLASTLSALWSPRALASVLAGWVVLAQVLRFRRRAYHDRLAYGPDGRKTLAQMDIGTAQAIYKSLGQAEFPFTLEKSLQFALFRTYGIPSISALLAKTSLFSDPKTAHKRYADTGALIVEFTSRDFASPQFVEAMARLNCIHGTYRGAGRISDADMLYTLALFALETGRWVAEREWRRFSDAESCAMGVVWRALGEAMDIPHRDLLGRTAWADGRAWLADLAAWVERYEAEHMVYAESNAKTATATTAILLWNMPPPLKPIGEQAVAALMDPRLRTAMGVKAPGPLVQWSVDSALAARAFLLRYFALPRFGRVLNHEERNASGHVHVRFYQSLPFYVKPTVWNRWGPSAWVSWAMGLPVPGPAEYYPQGFDPKTVGPAVGRSGQKAEELRVLERTKAVCPFAVETN